MFFMTFIIHKEVVGYPKGAPEQACKSMKPEHGPEPQQGGPDHSFSTSLSGKQTDRIKISLYVREDKSRKFKGFMIQVNFLS